MTDGQLTAQGLANLTALGNVITWQRAEYDFKFQKLEYDTDVPCLVLSEGRSMLPSDLQLMLKPDCKASVDVITEKYSGVGSYLTAALLTKLRTFLTQCRQATFNLTEDMMKAVQGDFVAMRQAAGGITVEDFHTLLVLARLVAKGHGRSSLLEEDWEKAKAMEVERRARVEAARMRRRLGEQVKMELKWHCKKSSYWNTRSNSGSFTFASSLYAFKLLSDVIPTDAFDVSVTTHTALSHCQSCIVSGRFKYEHASSTNVAFKPDGEIIVYKEDITPVLHSSRRASSGRWKALALSRMK